MQGGHCDVCNKMIIPTTYNGLYINNCPGCGFVGCNKCIGDAFHGVLCGKCSKIGCNHCLNSGVCEHTSWCNTHKQDIQKFRAQCVICHKRYCLKSKDCHAYIGGDGKRICQDCVNTPQKLQPPRNCKK